MLGWFAGTIAAIQGIWQRILCWVGVMTKEDRIEKIFSNVGDAVWTEVAPGNRRAILSQRPELMLVAFSFDSGAVGALHSHPHTQVSYVAEGSFDVTVDGVTTRLAAGASFIVAPNLVHGVVALEKGLLIDTFTPRRDDFIIA
jgi:quercetin dioxygenase-like cupin family protein